VSNKGIKIHQQYGIIEIKQNEKYPKFDPFILAQHASQVYFVSYPCTRRDKIHWRFVIKTRPRSRVDQRHTMEDALQEPSTMVNLVIDTDPVGELADSQGRYEEINIENFEVIGDDEEEIDVEEDECRDDDEQDPDDDEEDDDDVDDDN